MSKVYIIAEAGVNHNGDIRIAKKMVDAAKQCGADAIKFQTFISENLVSASAPKAEYQQESTGSEESQFEMVKKLELSFDHFRELKAYCEEMSIDFLSTPFDEESLEFLDSIGMKRWKIASGEITNYPLLVKFAKTKKPVILSTGMSTMEEIKEAIAVLREFGSTEISVLHCTTEYPAPLTEVNLRAMNSMSEELGLSVGYSDHTKGVEIPIAAVAMGAKIIEKHFTLDCNMQGPDHQASLEPTELKYMIDCVQNVEKALGDGVKQPTESEKKNMLVARKSIVAKAPIKQGEVFAEANITTKRPGTGISPMKWNEIIGKKARIDYQREGMVQKMELEEKNEVE